MPQKPSWHAEAQALSAQGLTGSEIGRRLNRTSSAVHKALHPELAAARSRAQSRSRSEARASKRDKNIEIPGLLPVWGAQGRRVVDFARVDVEDWEWLRGHRFTFTAGYAAKSGRRTLYLHHMLVGVQRLGTGQQTDHINRDKLDNRRANLRVVTTAENNHNRGGKYERCWWRQQAA